ncbi:CHY and RING finger domain protein [Aspergillus sclerotioniger CBS 115572]|uniref:CHY and RING finger domain protein n=1 Tax=Aspergillus sclerotioniger CBS 115572 TaxID=1450535 RepID=A0A317UXY0_9EURO|nr:CHY and RING finger domain protein [Aspergillus sclerotioniger CBS 115572]PWY66131.1 CHY and RING finger domain protein [Aspergillus sclerotioniger CBS 115572]
MSGLITSLFIEPVIRQARRLSQQASNSLSSSDNRPESPASTRDHVPPANGNYKVADNKTIMPDSQQEKDAEPPSHGEYAGSDHGRAISPTSLPLDSTNRHHGAEHSPSPGWLRNPAGDPLLHLLGTSDTPRSPSTSSVRPAPVAFPARETPQSARVDAHSPEQYSNDQVSVDEGGFSFSLPEDDGMGALRKKIHAIRDLRSSNADQARMIHALMTENYHASQKNLGDLLIPSSPQPPIPRSPKRADSPSGWSIQSSGQSLQSPASTAFVAPQNFTYNLIAEDLVPTYAPRRESESPLGEVEDMDTEECEEIFLGCQHYKRNVKLQCFACKKWFTCRFCHDEVEDHHLDRPKTENMLCMLCGHAQPAAQFCEQCGERTAQYYCHTCKLWDNDPNKSIYHCNDCGICRIGQGLGKDFFHCKTCSVCLPISIENTHRCIERSTQCDCPICGDYMFTSPETVVFMRCGHSIHQRCLSEYAKTSYRCPICSKTITNMESTFRNLDRTIQSQPMPAEFGGTMALIYCNDCCAKSIVKYHWLGLRCDMCESYNTAQKRLLHENVRDVPETDSEGANIQPARTRSSFHGADEIGLSTLASLRIDTSTIPGTDSVAPWPNAPLSADPNGQFSSYSLARARAVSPVISNYFGIPPDRDSERSGSTSFFGGVSFRDSENEDGGRLRLWGTKFKYSYGFLGQETESVDGTSDTGDEEADEDGASEDSESEEREDDSEDEEEDEQESINIFGHR